MHLTDLLLVLALARLVDDLTTEERAAITRVEDWAKGFQGA